MGNSNRENVRLNSMVPVRVMLENRSVVEALMENIGFGGVKLLLPTFVPVGNYVQLEIRHKDLSMSVVAECVWIKPATLATYDYCAGFAFQNVSAATYQKIRELLLQLADNDRMDL